MAKMFQLLLGCTGLGTLRTVLGTGLATASDTLRIQSTTDNVVTNTGKVLDTTATNQYDAVLLQVVADTRNVRSYLDTIREADTCYLTQSRVRLFRGHGTNSSAYATLLRALQIGILLLLGVVALLQSGCGALRLKNLTAFAYELVKSRHFVLLSFVIAGFCRINRHKPRIYV